MCTSRRRARSISPALSIGRRSTTDEETARDPGGGRRSGASGDPWRDRQWQHADGARSQARAAREPGPGIRHPPCERQLSKALASEVHLQLERPPPAETFDRTQLQVVPLKAIPVVAVVLAALVGVIAADWAWGLTFFHVVGGGLWTAIDLFFGFMVGPIIARLSVEARMDFSARFMPKMLLLMPTLVVCTMASGWQPGHHLGFTDASYFRHGCVVASYSRVGVISVIA